MLTIIRLAWVTKVGSVLSTLQFSTAVEKLVSNARQDQRPWLDRSQLAYGIMSPPIGAPSVRPTEPFANMPAPLQLEASCHCGAIQFKYLPKAFN